MNTSESVRFQQDILARYHTEHAPIGLLRELASSSLALQRLHNAHIAKIIGARVAKDDCSDARASGVLDMTHTFNVRSVAAGINARYFPYLYSHSGVQLILATTHFDGVKWEGEKQATVQGDVVVPVGCGGLHGFETVNDEVQRGRLIIDYGDDRNLEKYVYGLGTSDPILLAVRKASDISNIVPNKPVYAAVLDHRRAKLRIFAVFLKGINKGKDYISEIDLNQYDPREVYHDHLPELDMELLPDVLQLQLQNIRDSNSRQQEFLHKVIPDLEAYTAIQNPEIVHLGLSPGSLRARLPIVNDVPNSVYSVRAPVIKQPDGTKVIKDDIALAQIRYAIGNAVNSRMHGAGAFFNTSTILVETDTIERSEGLVCVLLELEEVQQWKDFKNTQIIVGQVTSKTGQLFNLQVI